MTCEYKDGMKVDYSGSLHIQKGNEVNVFIKPDLIPANIRNDLDNAGRRQSCEELRKVADVVTDTIGTRVCLH